MRDFWDQRADEDAFFFVDNRIRYGDPDLERFWQSGREQFERMHALLGVEIVPTDEVVEIGCGLGRMTRVLAEQARTVTAIDVSRRMLERASELNPALENVRWLAGDGTTLAGIADESADVVHSYVVFHHIPDPEITLGYVREIGRVLRPGGWAGFQISNDPKSHRRPPFRQLVETTWRGLRGRGPRGQAHRAWRGSAIDLDHLRGTARASGTEIERVIGERTIYCLILLRKRARSA